MANLFDPEFDAEDDEAGFRFSRAHLGRQAGADRLGASLYELAPGDTPFPFHFHFGNEELLIAIDGRPHLRDAGGWRQMDEGEVVAFPVGEPGAHQVQNRTDRPVRILMISEMNAPEVVIYPDSGKVGSRAQAPGMGPGGFRHTSRQADAVDYFDGESAPEIPGEPN